ncbi:MAG: CBS domain-containing protein [Chloroflexi bacterium]|nr:CBS domain-containing protein [Chloroflexota bacterium]
MSVLHVRDAMRKGVVSCAPTLSVRDAAKLMTEARVRALVVVDGDCGLVGLVSQTDLVNVTLVQASGQDWQALTVKDVMTANVLTVTPDESLSQAAKLLIDRHIHRLVVVDQASSCTPIGVLSMGDIVRALSRE